MCSPNFDVESVLFILIELTQSRSYTYESIDKKCQRASHQQTPTNTQWKKDYYKKSDNLHTIEITKQY